MTLDEFENWLGNHQEFWRFSDDGIWPELEPNQVAVHLPESYIEFLQRFQPLWLYRSIFLGEKGIADRTAFVHSLSQPNVGISYGHLTAFCCMSSSHNYLCFDGERVVDFNPEDAHGPIREVAASFPEFMGELVKNDGESFWLSN